MQTAFLNQDSAEFEDNLVDLLDISLFVGETKTSHATLMGALAQLCLRGPTPVARHPS